MAAIRFALEGASALRRRLTFVWDETTGELSGADAEFLGTWIAAARTAGSVRVTPSPAMVVITDPVRSALELGAVLEAMGYGDLPEPFMSALGSFRAALG